MSDIELAFTQAQEAALRASPAIATAMGGQARIYREVPQNAKLDYIVIGEDLVLDDSTECLDGSEILATVHIWAKGSEKARQLGSKIRATLNASLAIQGHDLVLYEFTDSRTTTDPDGSTHVTLRFRYLTNPSEA